MNLATKHLSHAALAVLALCVAAQADSKKYGELLKRIPDGANVIGLVDVESMLSSPIAQREKWRDELAARPNKILGVSAEVSKVAVALKMDMGSMNEVWKLGMAQLASAPPDLKALASREGGYVEQLQNFNVAWTPRNFYLASFPQSVVAIAMPANRQLMSEWLKSTLVKPRTFPPGWADRGFVRADKGSQVVLMAHLEDLLSPQQAEGWLRTLDFVTKDRLDPKLMGPQLASVKSAMLQVDISQGITGTLRVDFGGDIKALKPAAKNLIIEALGELGADLDAVRRWDATVYDTAIELSGPMPEPELRKILSVLSAPQLGPAYQSFSNAPQPNAEPAKGQQSPGREPSQDDVVKASQQYFRSVVDLVDSLKQQNDESYSRKRFWLDRSAKQIDELPILGVDNTLLDWGAKVALTLREMSLNINTVNQTKRYNLASSEKGSYVGWYGAGTYSQYDTRSTNIQANAMINNDSTTRWQALQTAIGEMRRAMVQKYNVDF